MPMLPKLPPSSLRPAPLVNPNARNTRGGEPRPYLVATSYRRTEIVNSRGDRAMAEQRAVTLFPHESEDARLTGSTRSLFRRLLALNLPVTTMEVEAMRQASKKQKFTA